MERDFNEVADYLKGELAGMGLDSPAVKEQLLRLLSLRLPVFSLQLEKTFHAETLRFAVKIEKQPENPGGYRIREITATLVGPAAWPVKVIEGIDIVALDRQMATLDWKAWYNDPNKAVLEQKPFTDALDAIGRLQQVGSEDARRALLLLLTRNWPQPMLDLYGSMGDGYPAKQDFLRLTGEQKQYTFDLEEWPQFSAGLALQVITGRVAGLASQIHNMLYPAKSLSEIQRALYPLIAGYPADFIYTGRENSPERCLDYSIPVLCKQGNYEPQSYHLAARYYPEVPEGSCEGISFRDLDGRMQAINWKDTTQLYTDPRDPLSDHTGKVAVIEADLYTLSKDPVAYSVADLLRLKYHQDIPFFKLMVRQSAFDMLEDLRPVTSIFPVDINLNKAASLLEGKAVLHSGLLYESQTEADWIRLAPGSVNTGSVVQFEVLRGPSRQAIEQMLDMLLVPNSYPLGFQQKLIDGQPVTVVNNLGLTLHLEVDPEARSLKVRSREGELIPFNFRLDPGFRAGLPEKKSPKKETTKRLKP